MGKKRKKIPYLPPSSSLVDTHCHLDMNHYNNDINQVVENADAHGVKTIITIGIDLKSSQKAITIAEQFPGVYATVGFHPHDATAAKASSLDQLGDLVEGKRGSIVAYGEIGLDYAKRYSPSEVQREVFTNQLALAKNLRLPVVIHDRDAHKDVLKILKQHGPFDHGGIMHCFSGDIDYAKALLDIGFSISIPGIVTFKNAKMLHNVAKDIPLEHIILETDGPFLAPEPYRGKRNEPLFLLYTAQAVASLRGIDIHELADTTTQNAQKLFGIPFS